VQRVDLLVHNAGQLITCASAGRPKRGAQLLDVGVIENGALAVSDGVIKSVGTSDQILINFSSDRIVDAAGRVVAPGFVDPHTHIVFAGNRLDEFELRIKGSDYLEILAAGGGINSTVRQTREASPEVLLRQAQIRLDRMLECGTTTCEIKTGYGLDVATELKMLRVIEALEETHTTDIVPTFLPAHTVPVEMMNDPNAYIDLIIEEMLPEAWHWYLSSKFHSKRRTFYCDIFAERNSFGLQHMRRLMTAASRLGFGVKAHVDQFTNLGGSKLGIELGAASIDHLDAITDEEIAMLAASDTIGVVIPTENFSAGKVSFAPARRLIDSGCAIAISTDFNPGSAPCPSQPMAMAIACRYQKLMPAEAMNAATINAAFAIGVGDSCGSIEKGKRADIQILGCDDYRQISYEFGSSLVHSVFKDGQLVYSKEQSPSQ
jgi:imidazolonepropionase